jgi:hypothetical protein
MTSRHPLLLGTRWLIPVAMALAILGIVAVPSRLAHIVGAAMLLLLSLSAWMLWLAPPVLRLDDEGYAIEQRGREKFRVAWSEVQRVRIDRRANAAYLDCGDKARNLFVPPRRGYGFSFADAATVCARVLAAVPAERVSEVERIDVP